MKKIKPKYIPDVEKVIYKRYDTLGIPDFYIKSNFICSDYRCKYSSKNWASSFSLCLNQINSVASTLCPKHRTKLIDVGTIIRIPPAGSKERKIIIEKFAL